MPLLSSIQLSAPPLLMGGTAMLSATGIYDDDSQQDITSQVVWTKVSESPDTSITGLTLAVLSSNGVVQISAPTDTTNGGSFTVSASLSGVTAEKTFSIGPLEITALQFVDLLTFSFNQILPQLRVQASFNDGTQSIINDSAAFPLVWDVVDDSLLSFTDGRGHMFFAKSGSSNVTVSYGAVQATGTLTVVPALLSIAISGANKALTGQAQQLTLTATHDDDTESNVSAQAQWSSSNAQIAGVDSTGLVTAVAPGTVLISADYLGLNVKFHFTIPFILSASVVAPASVIVGQNAVFKLVQHYSDGSAADITGQVDWFCSDPTLASINASGTLVAVAPGTLQVGAFQAGQSIQAVSYTILPSALLSIQLSASVSSLTAGEMTQLSALGIYTGGTQTDITSKVAWNAANPSAAISASGVVTAQSEGLAVLVATYQGVQGSLALNVFPPPDPNLQSQFLSHLTQGMKNYFDEKDVRVREAKYTLDAQLLNLAAQQLEMSETRLDRELKATRLNNCPANIDNRGVYYRQTLPAGLDYTTHHEIQSKSGSTITSLSKYDDLLPVPSRVEVDSRFTPVSIFEPTLFAVSGMGIALPQSWAVQRVLNPELPMDGKLSFLMEGSGFNQVNVTVRITGQRAPRSAWASKQVITSETLKLTTLGYAQSKFAWAEISEIQISNLPEGVTLSGRVGTFGLERIPDPARPYIDATQRDVEFSRYWTYDSGLLREEYLASNYQGYRHIQSYLTAQVSAIAVEPNTYGLFLGRGSSLLYVDRREPLPENLNATALTAEPYFGLDVSFDETRSGPLRYILLRPVAYAQAPQVNQYRYLLKTPQGSTYVLTPDGVLATFSATAGWRRGTPISLTIPLAQIGTYVITLQCVGSNNKVLSDSVPYPNFALAPRAQFDLSNIVPQIRGLSFDERGRLWVWSGEFAVPLTLHHDAYLLDPGTQSIYLTDPVQGLIIDGVTV